MTKFGYVIYQNGGPFRNHRSTYAGTIEANNEPEALGRLFSRYNGQEEFEYKGPSLSVGDIIAIKEMDTMKPERVHAVAMSGFTHLTTGMRG